MQRSRETPPWEGEDAGSPLGPLGSGASSRGFPLASPSLACLRPPCRLGPLAVGPACQQQQGACLGLGAGGQGTTSLRPSPDPPPPFRLSVTTESWNGDNKDWDPRGSTRGPWLFTAALLRVSSPGRLTLLGSDWGGGRGAGLGWGGGGAALGMSPDPSPLHFSSNWCGLVFIEYSAIGF